LRPVDEQTILVTGATDGLGRALARELAARGATVLVHGRSQQRLDDWDGRSARSGGSTSWSTTPGSPASATARRAPTATSSASR
jgi:NAD(P)-dependent dehydrogenase (short-subunit alcohol dehydrogenase family)